LPLDKQHDVGFGDMIAEFYEQYEKDKMNYLKISGAG